MNIFSTKPSGKKKHKDPLTQKKRKIIHNRHKIRMPLIYRFLSLDIAFTAASLVLDRYASPVTPKVKNYMDREE
jgi:hypothetical protein